MPNFAVIETGGKQYVVTPGQKLKVEKLESEQGAKLAFEPLLVSDEEGKDVKVGKPKVAGAQVAATVVSHGRLKKVEVVKYKPKVRYRKKAGHRQHYTEVQIDEIKA